MEAASRVLITIPNAAPLCLGYPKEGHDVENSHVLERESGERER